MAILGLELYSELAGVRRSECEEHFAKRTLYMVVCSCFCLLDQYVRVSICLRFHMSVLPYENHFNT